MPYLSKIRLDATAMRAHGIRDAYSVHRLVYSLFPIEKEEACSPRFLYADRGAVHNGRELLVLSNQEPSFPDDVTSSTTILSDRFFSFPDYRFQIDLNPVKRDKVTGKRQAILGQLNLLNWFTAQAAKWGFQTDALHLEAQIQPTRTFSKGTTTCLFNHVRFRGILHVVDAVLFQKSFLNGLGHGKAFGFGLLQLVPINKTL